LSFSFFFFFELKKREQALDFFVFSLFCFFFLLNEEQGRQKSPSCALLIQKGHSRKRGKNRRFLFCVYATLSSPQGFQRKNTGKPLLWAFLAEKEKGNKTKTLDK